jgi:murein endopeptidase
MSALCGALALCAVAMAAAARDWGTDPEAPPPPVASVPDAAPPGPAGAPDAPAPPDPAPPAAGPAPPPASEPAAPSRALGRPTDGSLLRGVQLPAEGPDHYTWDPVLERFPSRGWRRWGTDRLVATVQDVLAEVRGRHPELPRLAIGDLSRPSGGRFGRTKDFIGHASHQNGLDVDIYYPRDDRRKGKPRTVDQVSRRGAQLLVDAFVDAGAQYVFVGLNVGLTGPPKVVQAIAHHDDHLHVRLPAKG